VTGRAKAVGELSARSFKIWKFQTALEEDHLIRVRVRVRVRVTRRGVKEFPALRGLHWTLQGAVLAASVLLVFPMFDGEERHQVVQEPRDFLRERNFAWFDS
jgi:hypothetical protein